MAIVCSRTRVRAPHPSVVAHARLRAAEAAVLAAHEAELRRAPCPHCPPASNDPACGACLGTGDLTRLAHTVNVVCGTCGGRGTLGLGHGPTGNCPACKGRRNPPRFAVRVKFRRGFVDTAECPFDYAVRRVSDTCTLCYGRATGPGPTGACPRCLGNVLLPTTELTEWVRRICHYHPLRSVHIDCSMAFHAAGRWSPHAGLPEELTTEIARTDPPPYKTGPACQLAVARALVRAARAMPVPGPPTPTPEP